MATPSPVITEELRRQAIGRQGKPTTLEVEKGAILRFAQAVGDPNPWWNDEAAARKGRYGGLVAPPTFLRVLGVLEVELPFPLPSRLLDGGSQWEYFEPVRPGDRITAVATVEDIFQKEGRAGPMVFIIQRITYTNQFGEVVATQKSTLIRY